MTILAAMALLASPAAWAQTPAGDDPVVERDKPAPVADKGDPVIERDGAAPGGQPVDGAAPPAEGGAEPAPETEKKKSPFSNMTLFIMIGGFLLLYLWMSRGKKKEKQRRKEMLTSLRKNDKITTIGGIVGTIIEVRDDEVTVKVDESSNTRMKFAVWAIRGVGDAAKAENIQEAEKSGST